MNSQQNIHVCKSSHSNNKIKLKQSHYTPWRLLGERKYSFYSLLTSALDGVSGEHHAMAAFYPQERTPGSHWISGWVGPRAGLDTEARGKIILPLSGIEPR
jgi:hypothetical protein